MTSTLALHIWRFVWSTERFGEGIANAHRIAVVDPVRRFFLALLCPMSSCTAAQAATPIGAKLALPHAETETAACLHGLSCLLHCSESFVDKFSDIFLWVILPLLMILPIAVYAETVRCATELSRVCDPSQQCTSSSDLGPAIEYFIELRNEQSTARIAKKVGGKKVASWKASVTANADGTRLDYSMQTDPGNTFSLSESFNTFSYRFPILVGGVRWEQYELGTCSVETP